MLPIRCFTCSKVLGNHEVPFQEFKKAHPQGVEIPYQEFFDRYKIVRYCCKKIFLTHVDIFAHDVEVVTANTQVRKHLEVEKIIIAD